MTAADCATDRDAYLAQAESNREKRVAELTRSMEAAAGTPLHARFAEEREQAWMQEEQRRGEAFAIFRECMDYVKQSGSR